MGMHCSGTKVLTEYVSRFFDVDVEPKVRKLGSGSKKRKRVDTGTLVLGEHQLWKHTVPLDAVDALATGHAAGRPVVLFTVREVCSWMQSLSHSLYELFPHGPDAPRKRRQGCAGWMLGGVELRTSEYIHANPFPGLHFDSAPHLWASYVDGYLRGSLLSSWSARGDQPLFAVVRYEDLVLSPGDVVEELARLGLPRNDQEFKPIQESLSGGESREQLLRRVGCGRPASSWPREAASSWLREDQVVQVRQALSGREHLLHWLGYETP